MIEKHYRLKEVRQFLPVSERTLRRLLDQEPDIPVLPQKKSRSKRIYKVRLIPESVLSRLLTRMGGRVQ